MANSALGVATMLLLLGSTAALSKWEDNISDKLGHLPLPFTYNRTSYAAQHFEVGFKGLLQFWYDFAEDQFNAALENDPDFFMAHWGLAMSKHLFLWNSDNVTAGSEYLKRIRVNFIMNDVEFRYIKAAKALFNEEVTGSFDRVIDFQKAMFDIMLKYPDDDLAASYYGLAMMELANGNQVLIEETRAVFKTVLKRTPNHPAALHFILHAYDFSGGVAIDGVAYGLNYTDTITVASHGDHMPAHLYIRLGMWWEAVVADRLALEAGDAAAKHLNETDIYDMWNRYHSLEYLQYYLLQMARYNDALDQMERMRGVAQAYPDNTFIMQTWYRMAARQVLESRNYPQLASHWNVTLDSPPYQPLTQDLFWSSYTEAAYLLAKGIQAIYNDVETSGSVVNASMERIREIHNATKDEEDFAYVSTATEMFRLQLEATHSFKLAQQDSHNYSTSFALMEEAVRLQDSLILTPKSPSLLFIPSYEFYADLILQAASSSTGRNPHLLKAAALYDKALQQRPKRAASLYGLSRCLPTIGPLQRSHQVILQLELIWSKADVDFDALTDLRKMAQEIQTTPESNSAGGLCMGCGAMMNSVIAMAYLLFR